MYGTPSVALRVGGLAESIVDGETGLLADEPAELTAAVVELVRDGALRERLGDAARERAETFTWDRTAGRNLATLERVAGAPDAPSLRDQLRRSETLKAAGLAAASLASNAIALLFTVIFARLLGAGGYGSLAVLLSTFLILAVPGSALQVAVAREVALRRARHGRAAGRDAARVARPARPGHRAGDARRRARPAAARRPAVGRRGLGGGRDGADGRAVAAAVRRARRAAGPARLPAGRRGRSCSRRAGGWPAG